MLIRENDELYEKICNKREELEKATTEEEKKRLQKELKKLEKEYKKKPYIVVIDHKYIKTK